MFLDFFLYLNSGMKSLKLTGCVCVKNIVQEAIAIKKSEKKNKKSG